MEYENNNNNYKEDMDDTNNSNVKKDMDDTNDCDDVSTLEAILCVMLPISLMVTPVFLYYFPFAVFGIVFLLFVSMYVSHFS